MEEMNRQGLMVWLKSLVESGRCPGVSWVDKEQGIFKIPWSNQKSRGWQKEDSRVFLEYAKHTHKYDHTSSMDFPRWKQNLKSAINKNRFIERLRDKDRLCGPKPHRVYQFLTEPTTQRRRNDKASVVVRSLVCGNENRGCQSFIKAAEEVLFSVRNMSTSSSAPSYSDSESPFSPVMFFNYRLSLSPDINRGDICDQQQGNIPVCVVDYCDENEICPRDTSHNVSPPAPLPMTYCITDKIVPLSTCLDGVPGTQAVDDTSQEASDTMSPVDTYSNKTFILVQPQTARQAMDANSFSISVTGSNHDVLPSQAEGTTWVEQPATQVVGSFKLAQVGSPQPGAAVAYPTFIEKTEITSIVTSSTTTSHQHHLSGTHTNDRVAQQAGPGIESAFLINNADNTVSVHHSNPSSISELFGGCSYDLPSSMDTSEESMNIEKQRFSGSQFETHRNNQVSTSMPEHSPNQAPDDSVMHVQVLYGTPHRTVQKVRLTSSNSSCRLFFGAVNTPTMQSAMQGQQIAEEVELPAVDDLDYGDKTKSIIRKTLKEMELGIVISYRNGDIYVERRCLPRVYLSDGVSKSEPLPRSRVKGQSVETKAFDFNKQFTKSIELNARNEGPVPKDHFILTVGYEIIPNDDSPTRLVPVYIVVRHVLAASIRFKILGASTIAPNPMCSDPNSFDKTVAFFKEIDLKK